MCYDHSSVRATGELIAEQLVRARERCPQPSGLNAGQKFAALFTLIFWALQAGHCLAQDSSELSTEEITMDTQPQAPTVKRYNIPVGSGGVNLSAGFRSVYVDNVFLTYSAPKNDVVLVPEFDVAAYYPIGLSNSLVLDVGLAYYYYVENHSLNSSAPIVNPNSELAFNIRTGDFTIRPSETFSYQESPVYDYGGEFFNVYNSGRYARFENRVGALVTWDQHDLVTDAGYFHDNLWANGSTYNYVDHSSELFNADVFLALAPAWKVGLEGAGSVNNFDNSPWYDTWRARVGPALKFKPSQFLKASVGAGYERIDYDSSFAPAYGLEAENTYYAYANVEHQINRFFGHSLSVSHDNQLGFNAANLEGTHISYSLSWQATTKLNVSPHVSYNWYDESFGTTAAASLYHEKFTYLLVGFVANYNLDKHWRARLSWDYRLKDSDVTLDGYGQNQVAAEVIYQF